MTRHISRVRSHSRAFTYYTALIINPRASWGRRLHLQYESVFLSRTHTAILGQCLPHIAPVFRLYDRRRVINFNFSPNLALFQHVSHMQQRMFSQSSNEGMYVLASVECKRSESPQLLKVDDPRCVHILSTRGHKIHQRRGGP